MSRPGQNHAAYHESGKAEGGIARRAEQSSGNIIGKGSNEAARGGEAGRVSVGGEAGPSRACRRVEREGRE